MYLLQFPLSMSCRFQCRNLSPSCLCSFLSILLFMMLFNSLLVYKNTTDLWFCILQLYWIHWLNLTVFWWNLYNFLYIKSCHLQVETVLILSYSDAIYFFSCLIALARASRTIMYRSGESEHPCLVHGLSKKPLKFSPLNQEFSVGLWYIIIIWSTFLPYLI